MISEGVAASSSGSGAGGATVVEVVEVVATARWRTLVPTAGGGVTGAVTGTAMVVAGAVVGGGTVASRRDTSLLSSDDTATAPRTNASPPATGNTHGGLFFRRLDGCVGGSRTGPGPCSGKLPTPSPYDYFDRNSSHKIYK